MLLRVAGWAPDELVSLARDWLGRGHQVEVAQTVTYVALANRIPVTPEDAEGLRAALSDAGLDTDVLADLDLVEAVGMPCFAMAPMFPGRVAEMPYTLDLTSEAAQHDAVDEFDRAIMTEASRSCRIWRLACNGRSPGRGRTARRSRRSSTSTTCRPTSGRPWGARRCCGQRTRRRRCGSRRPSTEWTRRAVRGSRPHDRPWTAGSVTTCWPTSRRAATF